MSARQDKCLPARIKAVLEKVNAGDFARVGVMIDELDICPHRRDCEVVDACLRIHRAFLPLVPVG